MNPDRRALFLAFPALLAARSLPAAQTALASRCYPFEKLTVHHAGDHESREVLDGLTHEGCELEVHETRLAPGAMPHPPHHHQHEEMFLIREGTLEITVKGKSTRFGPGSVAFIASNDEHGAKNVGSDYAQYFVVAIS